MRHGASCSVATNIVFASARLSALSRTHGLRPPLQGGFAPAVQPIHTALGTLEPTINVAEQNAASLRCNRSKITRLAWARLQQCSAHKSLPCSLSNRERQRWPGRGRYGSGAVSTSIRLRATSTAISPKPINRQRPRTRYPAVKCFLETAGFRVKGEVNGCDAVAVQDGEPQQFRDQSDVSSMPRSLQEAAASLQQILRGSDGGDGATVGKRSARRDLAGRSHFPTGPVLVGACLLGCVGHLGKEAAVRKIEIGDVTIDAVIEREGTMAATAGFLSGLR